MTIFLPSEWIKLTLITALEIIEPVYIISNYLIANCIIVRLQSKMSLRENSITFVNATDECIKDSSLFANGSAGNGVMWTRDDLF